jgi:hypothetical protein
MIASRLRSAASFLRYSGRQVFAGKFIYFLLLAVAVFLFVAIVHTANQEVPPNAELIYYFLLVPGVLLVLYPSAYAVQGDLDAGMLETLFGIPDYRYKVWLARQLVQQVAIAGLLTGLAAFCRFALADFAVSEMVFHLMFPVAFVGSIGFLLATLTRSGNGAVAVLVLVVIVFWILTEPLEGTRWALFYNPFSPLDEYETLLRTGTTFYNRAYLLAASGLAILGGLLRLQNRERLV